VSTRYVMLLFLISQICVFGKRGILYPCDAGVFARPPEGFPRVSFEFLKDFGLNTKSFVWAGRAIFTCFPDLIRRDFPFADRGEIPIFFLFPLIWPFISFLIESDVVSLTGFSLQRLSFKRLRSLLPPS